MAGSDSNWGSHGSDVSGASNTWLVAFGNTIPHKGELMDGEQYFNNQIATTISIILGQNYTGHGKAGKPIFFK